MNSIVRRLLGRLRPARAEELEVESGYRRWAPTYGRAETQMLDLEEQLRRRLQPATAGKRVLDLGCGRGRSSVLAVQRGADRCFGVDPTLGMLLRPMAEARDLPRVAGRAGDLPFADASFDLVVSALVLGHLTPLLPVLREVRRVLRQDGLLVATVFHPNASGRGWQRTFRDEAAGRTFAVRTEHRDLDGYTEALGRAGFSVQTVDEIEWQGQPVVLGLRAQVETATEERSS